MRRLLAVVFSALIVGYAIVAFHFYVQERWSRAPSIIPEKPSARVRHPEALLAVLRHRFDSHRYTRDDLALAHRALVEAPSFYQSPFLLAMYYSNRLERPDKTREAYEAAIERYPANGRLHLAYATWLLESRGSLPGWRDPGDPARLRDPLPLAERHFETAIALEPELSLRAFNALARYRIPPARWAGLVSEHPLARTHLMDALFARGHREEGLTLLREIVATTEDEGTLGKAVRLSLEEDPELALEAALKWRSAVEGSSGVGPESLTPSIWISRAHMALGGADASYRALAETLERIEAKFTPKSRLSLQFLCAMGEEYLRRGQPVTAETLFGQAVSRSPSFVPALLGLARTYARAGDAEAALDRYEEILRVEPEHAQAREEARRLLASMSRY